jgi:hypothetical protein
MRTSLPRLALVTLTAGAALTIGACSVQADAGTAGPSAGAGSATTEPSATGPTGTPTRASKAGKPKHAEAKARACRTDDLDAVVTAQDTITASGTHRGLVQLTNSGSKPCLIDGWASVSLVNAAGEVVDLSTREVKQPGAPTPSWLTPGASAWEGIKWTACDKGDPTCNAGNTLRFNLEASTDGKVAELEGFPAPERINITMKQLSIGSVQPSRQGVVAW